MRIIFTRRADFRLKKGKILKQEILEAIKYPDKLLKKYGKYYFQKDLGRGRVEVVCEKIENNI